MPNTVIEAIIARHAGRASVEPGEIVWIELDVRSARDFGGANVVGNLQRHFPDAPVADPDKTAFTFDCVVPANTIPYAENQHTCRIFARERGVKLFDVDAGIGSHVMIEQGLALPGTTVVGTDSHLNLLGAVGCFGQGMGDADIAYAFATGRTWFEVPASIRVEIKGALKPPATAKDLALKIIGTLGAKGALGQAVELYGPAIDKLNVAERITVCSLATEMGAIAAFIRPGAEVEALLAARSGGDAQAVWADRGARYARRVEIEIAGMGPQIALPGSPSDVHDVAEVAGTPVDSVFVGSCTNGRFFDFAQLTAALRGARVADGVMAKAVPATREVMTAMLEYGMVSDLHAAGVIVSNPGCGGCASGQIGMTGRGEVQVSTSNRNFRGKQGMGETYLASPLTAAASARQGRITVPEVLG